MSRDLAGGLERFELHRQGIGLLPPAGAENESAAIWVRVPQSPRPLRTCNCGRSKGGNTCEHLKALAPGARLFEGAYGGDWQVVFERTLWHRLAKAIYAASPLPCEAAKVQQVRRGDAAPILRVLDPKGAEVARYLDPSPARIAFLERTAKVPRSNGYVDRAGLLDRLALFQVSDAERTMEEAGMKSQRRVWESSFWYRLAYHAVRTWGDGLVARVAGATAVPPAPGKTRARRAEGRGDERRERRGSIAERAEPDAGTFHPAVDKASGAFTLTHRSASGEPTLQITVPRKRVQAVLKLLGRHFPEQEDLQIHPVPLQSIFRVSRETELDLRLRPVIRLLQQGGEERFFDREEFERFRYGDLIYIPEMGILAKLPKEEDKAKKFRAPISMKLARSQVPAFLDEHADAITDGSLMLDEPLQGLKIWKTYDRVEVAGEPVAAAGGAEAGAGTYRLAVRYGFGDQTVSLAEMLAARRRKQPYLETTDGWVDLQAPVFDGLADLEKKLDAGEPAEPDGAAGAAAANREIYLSAGELIRFQTAAERPLEVAPSVDRGSLLRRLLEQRPPAPYETPEGFVSELREYQRHGVDWLRFLAEQRLGGLLCDDMGLGKTHQAMALMACMAAEGSGPPFLVVCPTSVMSHWRDKLGRFAPGLRPRVHHGAGRGLPEALAGNDVVITSYGVLRNDIEELEERRFAAAIFDEVQYLKNRDTISYEAASRLPVPIRIGLTGTPIENALGELKGLFDLVLPGYLGSDSDFRERFDPALPGVPGRQQEARLDRLRRRIAPFVLRRRKATVLDELPEKIEDVRTCELSPEQISLYRQVIENRGRELSRQLEADDGQPLPYLHIFAVLNLLKQICDHPVLVSGELEQAESYRSGKWDLYQEILRECLDSGQKVVVFSQYLGMLELMARQLEAEGIDFGRLQGSTRAEARGAEVERFNTDPDCRVFLASLKAGGTGIDLLGGSVVIHYDRWWNAAREDQATDRVHRMGQRRVVQVFKLVTEGTLEERIGRMIEEKRDLLDSVVREDDARLAKLFDRDQLLELLREI
ncbi:MAG: DEAD/DEAH box helicase [Holophagales bacterium]|nr:DEAD/DEAH box helicase [Holophagales bacterium]